jgi:hypothetical protein
MTPLSSADVDADADIDEAKHEDVDGNPLAKCIEVPMVSS